MNFGLFGFLRSVADEAAEAGDAPDLGGMIMHHLVDLHEVELPFGIVWHLPTLNPIHIGPLVIDPSPTKHMLLLLLSAVIVTLIMLAAAQSVTRRAAGEAPSGIGNAIEALVVYFRNDVVRANIGHGADAYTPLILTLFFFILVNNLLGLVPYGGSATGNLAVTAGLALVAFITVEVAGIKELGFKGYMGTIFYAPAGMSGIGKVLMLLIMTPVEFLGKLTKPFALAIRLFANMTAGHTLILSLLGLIFVFGNLTIGRWGVAGASLGMGTAIMILEVFVAFLQAYIFAMLTSVFIGLIRHAH
jgi:F-type H+-transporting ATPase subunit a